jgi:formylglycine-generating enzyme
MVFVDGSYCTKVERRCLRKEQNKPNHLTICHKFEHKTTCVGEEEKRSFCIDKYEYPNREGAHPPWLVSWYDAEATCASVGKRVCYESEWVTACEGPERTPFPYGWDRDQTACNIDNTWINPSLSKAHSRKPEVASKELARLDQSVPSGAMPRCVSGYGVHDLTGNFDEWVTSDQRPGAGDKSKWAGLKGGAWGHVRNACRPMTTSHPPEFTYYFISFRCCADAKGYPVYEPKRGVRAPKVKAADRAPIPTSEGATGPSKRKVQPENLLGSAGDTRGGRTAPLRLTDGRACRARAPRESEPRAGLRCMVTPLNPGNHATTALHTPGSSVSPRARERSTRGRWGGPARLAVALLQP